MSQVFVRKQQLWVITHHGHISTSALIAPDGILMEKYRTHKKCGQPGAYTTPPNLNENYGSHDHDFHQGRRCHLYRSGSSRNIVFASRYFSLALATRNRQAGGVATGPLWYAGPYF